VNSQGKLTNKQGETFVSIMHRI